MSEYVEPHPSEMTMIRAHLAKADPHDECREVRWTCPKGHEHHTKRAAQAHGGAKMTGISTEMLTHIRAAATLRPVRRYIVEGPPGHAEFEDSMETPR